MTAPDDQTPLHIAVAKGQCLQYNSKNQILLGLTFRVTFIE